MILSRKKHKIASPDDAIRIFSDILKPGHGTDRGKEHFWVVGLNVSGVTQYVELVSPCLYTTTRQGFTPQLTEFCATCPSECKVFCNNKDDRK